MKPAFHREPAVAGLFGQIDFTDPGQVSTSKCAMTTIFPPNLPREFSVTLVTASLASASFQTYTNSPDVCP